MNAASPESSTSGSARPRLLFVDDEQRVLNSMRIMFRREYDLYLASHGSEALDIVDRENIDVIVADHRMPQMTGVEVLSRVRTMSPRTVRILLTGYADLDAVEGSINESEVFRFLTKPCAPQQLKETVQLAAQLAREAPVAGAAEDEDVFEIVLETPGAAYEEADASAQGQAPPADAADAAAQAPAPAAGTADAEPGEAQAAGEPDASGGVEIVLETPAGPPAQPESTEIVLETPPGRAAAADESLGHGAVVDFTRTDVITRPPEIATPARAAEQSAPAPRPAGLAVVVFSTDERVIETVQRAVRGRIPVFRAGNIVQVIKLLTEHRPGVLVTDISTDRSAMQSMMARLKEHLPQLVTIAVSEHRDVLDMVWLINHGQIFRFLNKPLSAGRCAVSLQAALQYHRALLKNPELVRRHSVDAAEDGGLMDGVLSKLRSVKRLWASA